MPTRVQHRKSRGPQLERLLSRSSRSATALFSISIVIALSVVFYNVDLAKQSHALETLREQFHDSGDRLDRFQKFRAKDKNLFFDLLFSALGGCGGIRVELFDLPLLIETPRTPVSCDQMRKLATRCARAVTVTDSISERETFIRDAIGEVVDPGTPLTSEQERLAKQLASIDRPSEFGGIAYWVAKNHWPAPTGRGRGGGLGIHLPKPTVVAWDEWDEEEYVISFLKRERDQEKISSFLIGQWTAKKKELEEFSNDGKSLSLPSSNVSLRMFEILLGSSFIVIFFGLIFVSHRRHGWEPAGFPQLGSPRDPISGLGRCNEIRDYAPRIVWGFFLALPVAIFVSATLVRHNFVNAFALLSSDWKQALDLGTADALGRGRVVDVSSILFDFINFVALGLWVVIVADITGDPRGSRTLLSGWPSRTLIFSSLWVMLAAGIATAKATSYGFIVLSVFWALCIYCIELSSDSGSRFLFFLAVTGNLFCAFLFFS